MQLRWGWGKVEEIWGEMVDDEGLVGPCECCCGNGEMAMVEDC